MSENMTMDEGLSISMPDDSLPPVSLDVLPAPMQDACARAGWMRLMPVQAHALPYLMAGRDIMVQSRTGSGKTGAYLLPLLSLLDAEENVRLVRVAEVLEAEVVGRLVIGAAYADELHRLYGARVGRPGQRLGNRHILVIAFI